MLEEIIKNHTDYYFIRNEGGKTYILLYLPQIPFKTLPLEYAVVNPCYTTYTKLHSVAVSLEKKLSGYGAARYKGNLKRLFADFGLGIILRNSLLAIKPYGTRVSLEALVLDGIFAEKGGAEVYTENYCGGCAVCDTSCPVNAIDGNHGDCLRRRMNLFRSSDADFSLLDGGLLGCDACQKDCPYNVGVPSVDVPAELKEMLSLDYLTQNALFGEAALKPLGAYIGNNYINPVRIAFFALNAIRRKEDLYIAERFLNHTEAILAEKAQKVLNKYK